ncbi:MAG: YicC family protein [Candidatus Lambdaproteobacteria bacterium]|nr:YicC family protein [Candidatus Lambdaproteobacteria bacterium]
MTGFGSAERTVGAWRCAVELRSVNQRFLDVRVKLPAGLPLGEEELKRLIQARCERGKVEGFLSVLPVDEGVGSLRLNRPLARQAARLLHELRETLGAEVTLNLADLVNPRELVQAVGWEGQEQPVLALVRETVDAALAGLVAMREREGAALERELLERAAALDRLIGEIAPLTRDLAAHYGQRLRENIPRLTQGLALNEERIAQEVALYADRCDVSEELSRYRTHLDHLREMVAAGGAIGRRFEFLLQEINREATTLGNKSSDAAVSARVVEIKSILEKMREQIQNVE